MRIPSFFARVCLVHTYLERQLGKNRLVVYLLIDVLSPTLIDKVPKFPLLAPKRLIEC